MRFDVTDPHFYAGDPFPTYAWLRREAPVYWDEKNSAWIVSRYEDVVHVSKSPQIFCSRHGVMASSNDRISMITMDDPEHTRLRALVSRGFTPRMVAGLEPRIRELARSTVDAVARRGECDFVHDLAVPLPLLVIAEMIGIRPEDRDRFSHWSDAMILAAGRTDDPVVTQEAMQAYAEYSAYLQEVFEDRRRCPREDLVSKLVAAQGDGQLASGGDDIHSDELLMFMTLLLVAGNETTRNAISGGMLCLLENPAERARLLADIDGLLPTATEEILRYVSPVVGFRRTATQDTTLRGQRVRAGEKVVILHQSANRDEAVFPQADRFVVDRRPNEHVAFGIGTHFCLGANLARMEIRVMLRELLTRLPDMELAPGCAPRRVLSPLVRGIESMPVVFSPERDSLSAVSVA